MRLKLAAIQQQKNKKSGITQIADYQVNNRYNVLFVT